MTWEVSLDVTGRHSLQFPLSPDPRTGEDVLASDSLPTGATGRLPGIWFIDMYRHNSKHKLYKPKIRAVVPPETSHRILQPPGLHRRFRVAHSPRTMPTPIGYTAAILGRRSTGRRHGNGRIPDWFLSVEGRGRTLRMQGGQARGAGLRGLGRRRGASPTDEMS